MGGHGGGVSKHLDGPGDGAASLCGVPVGGASSLGAFLGVLFLAAGLEAALLW